MNLPLPPELVEKYRAVQADASDVNLAAYGAALQKFRDDHPYLDLNNVMQALADATRSPAA